MKKLSSAFFFNVKLLTLHLLKIISTRQFSYIHSPKASMKNFFRKRFSLNTPLSDSIELEMHIRYLRKCIKFFLNCTISHEKIMGKTEKSFNIFLRHTC